MKSHKVTQLKPKMISRASRAEFRPRFSPEALETMINLVCTKAVASIRERQAAEKLKAG